MATQTGGKGRSHKKINKKKKNIKKMQPTSFAAPVAFFGAPTLPCP
jgi:hypothetical protein